MDIFWMFLIFNLELGVAKYQSIMIFKNKVFLFFVDKKFS